MITSSLGTHVYTLWHKCVIVSSIKKSLTFSTLPSYNQYSPFLSAVGMAMQQMKKKWKLTRTISYCTRIGVTKALSLDELFQRATMQRCKVIRNDDTHPLHCHYQVLPSGRRLRACQARTARYAKSFIPSSIKLTHGLGTSAATQ